MNKITDKIVAYIPARLASTRYPRKLLLDILGIPMIEHVRRRAIISKTFDDVVVATCDYEIKQIIENFGGKVIMTSVLHNNGTSRISEAVNLFPSSHAVILQGDEPLITPEDLKYFVDIIKNDTSEIVCWNATAMLESDTELDKKSFVKSFVNHSDRILFLFRRTPTYSKFENIKYNIFKTLGLIGFKTSFLMDFNKLNSSCFEENESIEQMRIIENDYILKSVKLRYSYPSINEPSDLEELYKIIKDQSQEAIISNVINYKEDDFR